MKFKTWIAALTLSISGAASAITVDFDLTSPYASENRRGSYASEYSYEVDGLNLQVTGLSSGGDRRRAFGDLSQASVGRWNGGLGVERGKRHTVDNRGFDFDFLVFEFDQAVSLDGIGLGYIQRDSDLSFGALDNDGYLVSADSLYDASFGLNDVDTSVSATTWVIGAFHPVFGMAQDALWDGFKINQLSVNVNPVPLPAAVWFLASGLLALGYFRRKKAIA